MGIGGLDNEFSAIFRRAFASRVFPPDLVKKLGIQHVRGVCAVEMGLDFPLFSFACYILL